MRKSEEEIAGREIENDEVSVSRQSNKKYTTERGTWQFGQRGGSERVMRCQSAGVTNTKTSQDYLSVSSPLGGGTSSFSGGLNQGQLTPRLTYCSGDRRIKVLKGQG